MPPRSPRRPPTTARGARWVLALLPLVGGPRGDGGLAERLERAREEGRELAEARAREEARSIAWERHVAAVLLDDGAPGEAGRGARVRALMELGTDALPALVAVLGSARLPATELDDDPTARRLDESQLADLRAALALHGRPKVLPIVEAAAEADDEAPRHAALAALAVVGVAHDLPLAVAVGTHPDPASAHAQLLLDGLATTTEAIARRDPSLRTVLPELLRSVDGATVGALVRGASESGSAVVLPVLATDLLSSAERAPWILSALGRAARLQPRPLDAMLLEKVRGYLHGPDTQLARLAALALAELGDFQAFDELVALLTSEAPHLEEAGLCGLRGLTGLSLDADPRLWAAWRKREEAWFEREAKALFELLGSPYRSDVATALRGLAGHRWRRDEVAAQAARVLAHDHAEMRRLACSTLASIGAASVARELVPLLEDADIDVARAAHDTLERLTGRHLPPQRDAWADALALDP